MPPAVIVVNVRSFPTCFIDRATHNSDAYGRCCAASDVYTRVAPEATDATFPSPRMFDALKASGFAIVTCEDRPCSCAFSQARKHLRARGDERARSERPSVCMLAFDLGEPSAAIDAESEHPSTCVDPKAFPESIFVDARGAPTTERMQRATHVSRLQMLFWARFKEWARRFVAFYGDVAHDTIVVVQSDRTTGLYEHGCFAAGPWESCLRTFVVVHAAGQLRGSRCETPVGIGIATDAILHRCGVRAAYERCELHPSVTCHYGDSTCAEECKRAQARRAFVRCKIVMDSVPYAVTHFISAEAIREDGECEDESVMRYPFHRSLWERSDDSFVFDQATDGDEMHDLSAACHWKTSAIAQKLEALFRVMVRAAGCAVLCDRSSVPCTTQCADGAAAEGCDVSAHRVSRLARAQRICVSVRARPSVAPDCGGALADSGDAEHDLSESVSSSSIPDNTHGSELRQRTEESGAKRLRRQEYDRLHRRR